eukprot:5724455-Prymnesium_polylepis.1
MDRSPLALLNASVRELPRDTSAWPQKRKKGRHLGRSDVYRPESRGGCSNRSCARCSAVPPVRWTGQLRPLKSDSAASTSLSTSSRWRARGLHAKMSSDGVSNLSVRLLAEEKACAEAAAGGASSEEERPAEVGAATEEDMRVSANLIVLGLCPS